MDNTNLDFENCVLEKPYGFTADKKRFYLYPITLGKHIYLRTHYEALDINLSENVKSPYEIALKAVKEHKDEVLFIIAINTIGKGRNIFYSEVRNPRIEELEENCTDEDLATLLVLCYTKDNCVEKFKQYLKLDSDNNRKQQVMAAKKGSDNIYMFGGKSLLGGIIDTALERYHWTYQYVLWEISFSTLQLLLSDRITSIYLTDEEKKFCNVPTNDNSRIMADDPENEAIIEAMFSKK